MCNNIILSIVEIVEGNVYSVDINLLIEPQSLHSSKHSDRMTSPSPNHAWLSSLLRPNHTSIISSTGLKPDRDNARPVENRRLNIQQSWLFHKPRVVRFFGPSIYCESTGATPPKHRFENSQTDVIFARFYLLCATLVNIRNLQHQRWMPIAYLMLMESGREMRAFG